MSSFLKDTHEAHEGHAEESDSEGEGEGEGLTLSPEALLALTQLAAEKGIPINNSTSSASVLSAVKNHYEVKDKNDIFKYTYTSPGREAITITCSGVKRELGQTLNSTGLTIWRAAEQLCTYIYDHASASPREELFWNKKVCELGAGIGIASILLEKCGVAKLIVATDGDDDTCELMQRNFAANQCASSSSHIEKLWWGEHASFLEKYGQFDVLMAADVIYEKEQVQPLFSSAAALLASPHGVFILSYARRNVKIDDVFEVARAQGFVWRVVEDAKYCLEGTTEAIYIFTFPPSTSSSSS